MRAVVVVETVFGNTRAVADAVAEGLAERADVAVYDVTEASQETLQGADLVVIGGPTHAHGMTWARTRAAGVEEAVRKGEDVESAEGPALRDWFDHVPAAGRGAAAAAFDTRATGPALLTGRASKGIARRLADRGYRLVSEPESFLVEGTEGPLAEGELERARAWGASLAGA